MRTIIDIGKQGAEHAGEVPIPEGEKINPDLHKRLEIIRRLPVVKIEADVSDGTKKSVEVHPLRLENGKIYDFVHGLAVYEPMLYVQSAGRTALGMLSPNYDESGTQRLPSIKVLPLRQAYPLTSRLTPDARMATMLAGAVSAERRGQGGHGTPDFEHTANVLGAVSLGDASVLHGQHDLRRQGGSLATGLTNGRLGNLYVPSGEFPGYGDPIHNTKGSNSVIYFPRSFVDTEMAFGVSLEGASRIMYGAGLQTLHDQMGAANVNSQISRIAGVS